MMRAKGWIWIVAGIVVSVCLAAEAATPVAKVTSLTGTVKLLRDGKISPVTMVGTQVRGGALMSGDVLGTGPKSSASVLFDDQSTIDLGEKTMLGFKVGSAGPVQVARSGKTHMRTMGFFVGSLKFNIRPSLSVATEFQTRVGVATVRGTGGSMGMSGGLGSFGSFIGLGAGIIGLAYGIDAQRDVDDLQEEMSRLQMAVDTGMVQMDPTPSGVSFQVPAQTTCIVGDIPNGNRVSMNQARSDVNTRDGATVAQEQGSVVDYTFDSSNEETQIRAVNMAVSVATSQGVTLALPVGQSVQTRTDPVTGNTILSGATVPITLTGPDGTTTATLGVGQEITIDAQGVMRLPGVPPTGTGTPTGEGETSTQAPAGGAGGGGGSSPDS